MSKDNDVACIIQLNVLIPLVFLICACIMVWFLHQYLKAESDEKRKLKSNKCLYYNGIIFGICTILIAICGFLGNPLECRESTRVPRRIFGSLGTLFLVVHVLLLLSLLFARLRFLFASTEYPVSRCSVITFTTLYTGFVLFGLLGVSLYSQPQIPSSVWTRLLLLGMFLFYVSLNIFLVSLYVYKLVVINKASTSDKGNDRILTSITKATVLTVFSILSTVLSGIVQTGLSGNETAYTRVFIILLCIANDAMTNFLAIYLAYGHFTEIYMKVCGCCDSKCKSICRHCVGNKDVEKMEQELQADRVESVNSATHGDETAVV